MAPSSLLHLDPARRCLAATFALLAFALPWRTFGDDLRAAGSGATLASPVTADASAVPGEAGDPAWWRDGVEVFASLWDDARARLKDGAPDWLQHLSPRRPATPLPDASAAYVVVQDDRADGMDLVTLRYRLAGQGPFQAYAGAGLNHARYFIDDPTAGPTLLTRQNRHSDVGATAELGAELALGERVRVNADLRWADIDERADLLHTQYGPIAADPVTIGLSLGYRFR